MVLFRSKIQIKSFVTLCSLIKVTDPSFPESDIPPVISTEEEQDEFTTYFTSEKITIPDDGVSVRVDKAKFFCMHCTSTCTLSMW